MESRLVGGKHYPRTYGELLGWFARDADCLDCLDWLRWPNGFVCPAGGAVGGWRTADGLGCVRHSPSASQRLQGRSSTDRERRSQYDLLRPGSCLRRRMGYRPLVFSVPSAWPPTRQPGLCSTAYVRQWFAPAETGSAASWRLTRHSSVVCGQDPEDEVPKERPWWGLQSSEGERRASGVAACRSSLMPLAYTHGVSSRPCRTRVQGPYRRLDGIRASNCPHERYVAPGQLAHELLPGVRRVVSLAKWWLLSTHQGAVEVDHLQSYLDEFTFRFSRRRSRSPGLIFYRLLAQAVAHDPIRYRGIMANPSTTLAQAPRPPGGGGHPASLDQTPAARPWRQA